MVISNAPNLVAAVEDSSQANVTGSAGAETVNAEAGLVTTESLTVAQNVSTSRTLTNSRITAQSNVLVFVVGGTNTANVVATVMAPSAGSVVIKFLSPLAAGISGTIKYLFQVLNQ